MMITYPFASHFRNLQPDLRENLASQQDATKCVAEAAAVVVSAMTWAEVGSVVVAVRAAAPAAPGGHLGGKEDVGVVAYFAWASAMTRSSLMMARPRRSDIFAVARPAYWRTEALPVVVAAERTGLVEVVEKGRGHVVLVVLVARSRTAQQVMFATLRSHLLAVIDSEKTSAGVFPKQLRGEISAHSRI
jgi:hypothetical protein